MSKNIEPQNQESDSIVKQALKWAFTVVVVFMLVRLGVAAVIIGSRVFGLLREGNILDRLSEANPTRLTINIAVIVVVVIVVIVTGVSKSENKEQSSENDEQR